MTTFAKHFCLYQRGHTTWFVASFFGVAAGGGPSIHVFGALWVFYWFTVFDGIWRILGGKLNTTHGSQYTCRLGSTFVCDSGQILKFNDKNVITVGSVQLSIWNALGFVEGGELMGCLGGFGDLGRWAFSCRGAEE